MGSYIITYVVGDTYNITTHDIVECGSKVTFCNIYAGIYECPKHGVIQVYYYDTIEKVITDDAT